MKTLEKIGKWYVAYWTGIVATIASFYVIAHWFGFIKVDKKKLHEAIGKEEN